MVDKNYTDLAAVRSFNQDDDMLEELVEALIPAVSRAIDRVCRRKFFTVEDVRLYDWQDGNQLRLRDDLISLNSVTTNANQMFVADTLVLDPRSGPPYMRIGVRSGMGARFAYTVSYTEAISVDGVWGYQPVLPVEIDLSCKAWVSDIYAGSDTRGMESMSGGGIRASLRKLEEGPPPDVKGWLSSFIKPTRLASGGFWL